MRSLHRFCFVHLDVDVYQSTLDGLEFFFPRLQTGGVLLSHDYNSVSCPGVRRAFDEYFNGTVQDVVPLWDSMTYVKNRDAPGDGPPEPCEDADSP
jgi:hypothetical protein